MSGSNFKHFDRPHPRRYDFEIVDKDPNLLDDGMINEGQIDLCGTYDRPQFILEGAITQRCFDKGIMFFKLKLGNWYRRIDKESNVSMIIQAIDDFEKELFDNMMKAKDEYFYNSFPQRKNETDVQYFRRKEKTITVFLQEKAMLYDSMVNLEKIKSFIK